MVLDKLQGPGMLNKHLIQIGYIQSKQDYYMFTKNGDFTAIVVYVDDLLIIGSSLSQIQFVKNSLHEAFTINDLDHLKYCLELKLLELLHVFS